MRVSFLGVSFFVATVFLLLHTSVSTAYDNIIQENNLGFRTESLAINAFLQLLLEACNYGRDTEHVMDNYNGKGGNCNWEFKEETSR